MDDLTKTAFLNRPDLRVETSGEFTGWRTWSRDNRAIGVTFSGTIKRMKRRTPPVANNDAG